MGQKIQRFGGINYGFVKSKVLVKNFSRRKGLGI